MWKPLSAVDEVTPGDLVRYMHAEMILQKVAEDSLFEVVKAERHYFEIIPKTENEMFMKGSQPERKIIKYIDLGYYVSLEIWKASLA
ncbi:MAG: hypothetical protein JST39_17615 [Bacteroidetes bacterium]|nr:hypothetical protein [Bacteroidota bacterium]